jgi:hypothetical protein
MSLLSNALFRLRRPSAPPPPSAPYVLRAATLRELGLLPAAPPLRPAPARAASPMWAQSELRAPLSALPFPLQLRLRWGVLLRLRQAAAASAPARAAAEGALPGLLPPALLALARVCEVHKEPISRQLVVDLLPLVLAALPAAGGEGAARVGRRYLRLLASFQGAPQWAGRVVGSGGPHQRLDLARALLARAPVGGGAEALRLRASWLPHFLALCARLGAAGTGGAEAAALAAEAAAAGAAGDGATAAALTLAAKKARRRLSGTVVHARGAADPFLTAPGGGAGGGGGGGGAALLDAELELALHAPAAAGMAKLAKEMLRRGAEVDAAAGALRETPLMAAARGGFTRVVEELLRAGADVSKRRADGATAAELAQEHPAVLNQLQKWGRYQARKQGRGAAAGGGGGGEGAAAAGEADGGAGLK